MFEIDDKYPAGHPKDVFWQLYYEIVKNQLQNIP